MKYFSYLLLIISFSALGSESSLSGKVLIPEGCSKKAMVWLSLDKENYQERLLLLHTEVPRGGTFRFYVKAGNYQIRASDKEGCEFLQKVRVENTPLHLNVKLVKK